MYGRGLAIIWPGVAKQLFACGSNAILVDKLREYVGVAAEALAQAPSQLGSGAQARQGRQFDGPHDRGHMTRNHFFLAGNRQ